VCVCVHYFANQKLVANADDFNVNRHAAASCCVLREGLSFKPFARAETFNA
jgi:hypothetical protein